MSRRERINAFEAWLRARDHASELALFSRSTADGILSLTGGGPLEPAHVEQAASLARDAGMTDTSKISALGALLLEFEAVKEAAPAARAPVVAAAPVVEAAPGDELARIIEDAALLEPAPAAEPAPFTIKLKATEPEAPRELAPEPAPAPPAAHELAPRPRRAWIGYAIGAGLLAALAVVGLQLRGHARAASQAPAAHDARVRLRRVPLFASVPRDWHEASEAELPADGQQPVMSLVYRGGSAADPERGMFVAVLRAAAELGGHPADAALISAASTGERGLGAVFAHGSEQYVSAGCTVVPLGGVRTGACVGTIEKTGGKSEVAIYVRVIGDHEIVAMTVTRVPSRAASAEVTALVASLTP